MLKLMILSTKQSHCEEGTKRGLLGGGGEEEGLSDSTSTHKPGTFVFRSRSVGSGVGGLGVGDRRRRRGVFVKTVT